MAGALAAYLLAGPVLMLLAIGAAAAVPKALRRRRTRDMAAALDAHLASAVDAVCAALRAGLSLSQALRYAADETPEPLAGELRAVSEREDLGLPLEASLERWGEESSSDDVRLVANALRLRLGSGLPRVLDELVRTLRHRRTVAREVRSLTAQARLSGTILSILPAGFFLFLALTSRHDMAAAITMPAGMASIFVGVLLQTGGYLWIRRLVRVEVS